MKPVSLEHIQWPPLLVVLPYHQEVGHKTIHHCTVSLQAGGIQFCPHSELVFPACPKTLLNVMFNDNHKD